MRTGQSLWTKDQLILTINLYSKLTFGQLHQRNPAVIELARFIEKTPGAVAFKLVNFASLDPRLTQKGMEKVSKLDREVWQNYIQNWDDVFIEGEKLLAQKKNTTIEKLYNINLDEYIQKDGLEVQRWVKMRLNQEIFREAVLTNFDNQCCITRIKIADLIVASHIAPWSIDSKNRLNPRNGLALNGLHDKAFDKHLITITDDLKIKISSKFYKDSHIPSIKQNFIDLDGTTIILPKKFYPDSKFLKLHNDKFKP